MFIDLAADAPEHEKLPGFKVRFVHSETMTFGYWTITAGAKLPAHRHPHEQVTNVIKGEFELTIDGESKALALGDVAVIPSNSVHSGTALSDCYILDVFYPIREDYR